MCPLWVDEVIFLQTKVTQKEPLRAWPCHPTVCMNGCGGPPRRPLGGHCTTRGPVEASLVDSGEDMTHDGVTCRTVSRNTEEGLEQTLVLLHSQSRMLSTSVSLFWWKCQCKDSMGRRASQHILTAHAKHT